MSTRADDMGRMVDGLCDELWIRGIIRERADTMPRRLIALRKAELGGALGDLDDATKQFVTASQATAFCALGAAMLALVDACKVVMASLPDELHQCKRCGRWWDFDAVDHSYEAPDGRTYDRLCGECVYVIGREFGEDN